MSRLLKIFALVFLGPLVGLSQDSFDERLSELQKTFAPDKRTAIFEYQITESAISVKTDIKESIDAVKNLSKAIGKKLNLSVLPLDVMGGDSIGLINLSVANIRSKPGQSAELATQALLGTPIRVLEKVDGWYRVQTPDKYIGYLEGSSFVFKKAEQIKNRQLVIFTSPFGFSKSSTRKNSPTVSDLTWGDILELKSTKGKFYQVEYPDGRLAFISKLDALELSNLNFDAQFPDGDQLVTSASQMKGIPYLWGGTSWKGVDCSGFTRTVFLMNGVYLPRDASQQALIGQTIDFHNDFSLLEKGDLFFFGRVENGVNKVTHVAMSVGKGRFIHSSGMVRYGSLDPTDEFYDDYNSNRLLFVKRLENSLESNYFLNNETLY